jgi:hypothetical protein
MVVSIVVVIIAVVIIKVGVLMYGHEFNLARPGLLDHAARTPPLERPASAPRQRFPAMPETAGIAVLSRKSRRPTCPSSARPSPTFSPRSSELVRELSLQFV